MKTQITVAIVLILVLGGLIAGYHYLVGPIVPAQEEVQPVAQVPAEPEKFVYLEAAKEIQGFIDTRRTDDGYYKYSYNCENRFETDCNLDLMYESTNAWTTLSNLRLYQATGEQAYLERAKRDADAVMDWCAGQPNDGKICLWILVQISELYEETGDQRYADFLLGKGEMLLNIVNDTDSDVVWQRNSTMMIGIDARELAAIYKINGDQRYIDEAKIRIEEAYWGTPDNYPLYQFNGNNYLENSCWPELANMEIYEATGDQASLAQALDLLDTLDPATNVFYMNFLTNLQSCNELYLKAYEATGDNKYMEGAVKMADFVLVDRWDSPENNLVSGSGTILSDDYSKVDTLTDTAYMV
ncbi:MAG: hypothetical protein HY833_00820, partial [Candidatus Aenigmarchaeota archaeon]|nr:hypothetical protein [Candidatus Aenigmarchaeota archaeon]